MEFICLVIKQNLTQANRIYNSIFNFRIKPAPRLILGVSLCGATGYILYLLLRKRPDAEECTYASTYLTGEDWSKLVIQVPRQFVPFIIGRKGQKIREIEDKTGTKISFEREINNENTCECTIRGVPVQCEQAQYIIEDLIEQAPVISTESFTVARILIVSVLGKNEENLNYIQERSGAKMWVSEDLGSEARVYIRGKFLYRRFCADVICRFVYNRYCASNNKCFNPN